MLLASLAASVVADAPTHRLLLAGGHLPVCSSFAPRACRNTPDWPEPARTQRSLKISPERIRAWADAMRSELEASRLRHLVLALMTVDRQAPGPQTPAELREAMRALNVEIELTGSTGNHRVTVDGEALYETLSDRHWNAIVDFLERPPRDAEGNRQVERVDLDASRSQASAAIYRRFVAMAAAAGNTKRPLIAISTAASRDPYDALDFYRGVFQQAGADVVWLPLDAALQAARAAGQCERLKAFQADILGAFERARVWPEKFAEQQAFCRSSEPGTALIDQIDGLFLNGGDQWLTLHAFRDAGHRPTPELERILARLADGSLALGGTSAGSAVQSAAFMISNGSARAALEAGGRAAAPPPPGCERDASCPKGIQGDTLTWHPPGGLKTFSLGVADTHFSQRMRQFRLLQLLAGTGQRYGFGIDETTALEVLRNDGHWNLRVHGRGGIWILDLPPNAVTRVRPLAIESALMLRLGSGQQIQFDPVIGLVAPPGAAMPGDSLRCRRVEPRGDFDRAFRQAEEGPGCITLQTSGGRFELSFGEAPVRRFGVQFIP